MFLIRNHHNHVYLVLEISSTLFTQAAPSTFWGFKVACSSMTRLFGLIVPPSTVFISSTQSYKGLTDNWTLWTRPVCLFKCYRWPHTEPLFCSAIVLANQSKRFCHQLLSSNIHLDLAVKQQLHHRLIYQILMYNSWDNFRYRPSCWWITLSI